jgi:hypothetical protein
MTTGGKRWRRYEISAIATGYSASLPNYPVTLTTPGEGMQQIELHRGQPEFPAILANQLVGVEIESSAS